MSCLNGVTEMAKRKQINRGVQLGKAWDFAHAAWVTMVHEGQGEAYLAAFDAWSKFVRAFYEAQRELSWGEGKSLERYLNAPKAA